MAEIPVFPKYMAFRLYKEVFAYYPQDPVAFSPTNKDPEVERS